jgi:hypothetical protein
MELNYSFNTSLTGLDPHFFDKFLVNLNSDPYASMFSDSSNVPIAEEQSDDYNYLEYIGPPMDYNTRSAPSQSVVGNEFLQGMGSTGEGPVVRHFIYMYMKSDQVSQFHSTGLRLSQELPPLPAPRSISSPSHTEAEDITVNDMDPEHESEVAPQNINLKLDESNIVPGKPIRAVSSRATEEGQPKEVYLRGELVNNYGNGHQKFVQAAEWLATWTRTSNKNSTSLKINCTICANCLGIQLHHRSIGQNSTSRYATLPA